MRVKKYKSKYGLTTMKRGEVKMLDFGTDADWQNIRVAASLAKARHGQEYKTERQGNQIKVKRVK